MSNELCAICVSVYEQEIAELLRKGVSIAFICHKYKPLLDYKYNDHAFRAVIYRHKKHIKIGEKQKRYSVEDIVGKMTDMAGEKLENMTPEDVKFGEVFQGHRTLIEKQKVKLSESAMILALGKLFGPPIIGEIIDEPKRLGREESPSSK